VYKQYDTAMYRRVRKYAKTASAGPKIISYDIPQDTVPKKMSRVFVLYYKITVNDQFSFTILRYTKSTTTRAAGPISQMEYS